MHELPDYIKYYDSNNSKVPDHSILSCTLTVTYYECIDVIEPNNDNRMYNCNVNVISKHKLTSHDINRVKFKFPATSERFMNNQHFIQCIDDLTKKWHNYYRYNGDSQTNYNLNLIEKHQYLQESSVFDFNNLYLYCTNTIMNEIIIIIIVWL